MYPGSWEKDARIGGKYGYKSPHTKNLDQLDVTIRQVPGDGNCLFHSLSTALSWVEDRAHLDFDESFRGRSRFGTNHRRRRHGKKKTRLKNLLQGGGSGGGCASSSSSTPVVEEGELDLFTRSTILRQLSVDVLSEDIEEAALQSRKGPCHRKGPRRKRPKPLFLQGSEFLHHDELLDVACSQYDMSGDEYCDSMRNNGVWGGGPEIVALCNYLKRPIHVYELMTVRPSNRVSRRGRRKRIQHQQECDEVPSKPEFRLRRMALFGSPKFDYREPLHILSADCRFPDIEPGQQAAAGNHFMAMFIEKGGRNRRRRSHSDASSHSRRGVRVRSGGSDANRRPQNTFTKREVIMKYLRSNENSFNGKGSEHGFMQKMKRFIFDDETTLAAEIENDDNNNPFEAAVKWCYNRSNPLGFFAQE